MCEAPNHGLVPAPRRRIDDHKHIGMGPAPTGMTGSPIEAALGKAEQDASFNRLNDKIRSLGKLATERLNAIEVLQNDLAMANHARRLAEVDNARLILEIAERNLRDGVDQ